MNHDAQARFDAGAEDWGDYYRTPLGRIRLEVSWKNLVQHVPPPVGDHSPRVLDVGGGSGELALKLVERGCRVWLLDYSPAMLNQARRTAQDLPESARDRLTFCHAAVEDAARSFAPEFFDVVICHTLIEYLTDPQLILRALTSLLRSGGLLSVSFVNRHAEVPRQVWSRVDPRGALAKMEDNSFQASLFDISGVAYTAGEVGAWLTELGLTLTATYGVRAFADYVPRKHLDEPGFFDALLQLEVAAAARSPYNLLARYAHLIARRHIDASP